MAEPAALQESPALTPAKTKGEPKNPILWTANYRKDTHTSLRQDAFNLERLIMTMANHPMIEPVSLASLVRSWCQLVDTIRIIQGKPLPGQLRPDLDPAQAMKALKRIRERLPVDIAGQKSGIVDEPGPTPAKAKGGRPAPKNPLTNPPIESVDGVASPLDLPDDEPTE